MIRLLFVGFVLCFGVADTSLGDVAYSSFGLGDSFDDSTGEGFGDLTSFNALATNYHSAKGFTAEATGQLASIEVPISLQSGAQSRIAKFELWTHEPGPLSGNPNQMIWSGTTSPVTNQGLDFAIHEIAANAGAPVIESGTIYWLVASSDSGADTLLWAPNDDPMRTARFSFSYSEDYEWLGQSFTTERAYRVNVNAVPEPCASPFALLVLIGCVRFRFKSNPS